MATIPSGKLDQIIPPTVDFPARHIGPRKHDVRYYFDLLFVALINSSMAHQNSFLSLCSESK